jgi:hypothetical protein
MPTIAEMVKDHEREGPPLRTLQRRCRTDVNQSQSELEWVWFTLDAPVPTERLFASRGRRNAPITRLSDSAK